MKLANKNNNILITLKDPQHSVQTITQLRSIYAEIPFFFVYMKHD